MSGSGSPALDDERGDPGHVLRWRWIAALGPVLVVLILGELTAANVRDASLRADQVSASYERMAAVDAVIAGLTDAETGQRGYLLTGSEEYLAPYLAARHDATVTLDVLRARFGARADSLGVLAAAKLAELDSTIALRHAGRNDDALAIVATGRGNRIMGEARNLGGLLDDEERLLLQSASRAHALAAQRATASAVGGTLGAALFAFLIYWILTRSAQHAAAAAAEARATHAMHERIREHDERLRRITDSGIVGVFSWNLSGAIFDANPAFLKMLGYSKHDLDAGRIDWRMLTPTEFLLSDADRLDELERTGSHGPYEKLYLGKDGRPVPVLVASAFYDPPLDGDGRRGPRDSGVCICIDVSARQAAEMERERLLLVSERARNDAEAARERVDAVLASITDAFYLLDREWRFTDVNPAAEPLLRTTRDRLLGRTMWEAFPGVTGSVFEGPYREAMATGRPTAVEAYYEPLGTWFDVHTYPWAGGVMVHFRDVGDRKAVEADLARTAAAMSRLMVSEHSARERIERLQLLTAAFARALSVGEVATLVSTAASDALGASTAGVMLLTPDGRELEVVHAMGWKQHGDTLALHQRFPVDAGNASGQAVLFGQPVILESVAEYGARFPDLASLVVQRGLAATMVLPLLVDDRPIGTIGFSWDHDRHFAPEEVGFVTALAQQAAQALRRVSLLEAEMAARQAAEEAREEAQAAFAQVERAIRAKSSFLAMMSHELRTPLNAIRGYADLMGMGLYGPMTAEQLSVLARITASERHLLGIIEDILDFARIDAGHLALTLGTIDVRRVIADAEVLLAPQLERKQLAFVRAGLLADVAGDAPVTLPARADADRLRQVIVNLLSNAAKFTESGGTITVSASVDSTSVCLSVQDTGQGIAAGQLEQIFAPFTQVEAALTRTRGGAGLGLAISRELARAMHGDITVTSTPGVGSVFSLTLPRASAAPSMTRRYSPAAAMEAIASAERTPSA